MKKSSVSHNGDLFRAPDPSLFSGIEPEQNESISAPPKSVTCLGHTFASDDERREYFRAELRRRLPDLRHIEGFPIGSDDDIIALSDPPYFTACPNPWLNDFIAEWEAQKAEYAKKGARFADFKVTEPYSDGIKQGKNSAIYNAHTYHTKVPHEVIMRYILHYTQPGDIVLDGFAGTGMTGVAASACGFPDASTKATITQEFKDNGHKAPRWGLRHSICGDLSPLCFHISSNYNHTVNQQKLQEAVKDVLAKLKDRFGYLYEVPLQIGGKGHINYFVWSEIVACRNCGAELNVHDLSFDYNTHTLHKELTCPHCGTSQERKDANSIKETIFDEISQETYEALKYRVCAFNYSVLKSGRNMVFADYEKDLPDFLGYIPTVQITSGDKYSDPKRVGCNKIDRFYAPRTKSLLAYLYQIIQESQSCKKELMFIFTSMLPKLTRMNRYMPQHGSRALVGPMANTLYIPPQYVENNPIDQFEYQAGKVIRALKLCTKGCSVQIVSATNQLVQDNSIDYIFTDPPFGANIMYSELNLIAESWLKLKTDNHEEAISNKTQHKGILEYQEIMTRCFKEYFRILKPGKWITVEFSNTSAAFWNALQYSLQSAGFILASVTDLNKERGGLHSMLGPTAVKQDLAITCYKPDFEIREPEDGSDINLNVSTFVENYLLHLPVHIISERKTSLIVERTPKLLFDRMVAYFVQRGFDVPMNAREFQQHLRDVFVERDGMYFTAEQAIEYDSKRSQTESLQASSLFVGSEAEGIEWLKRELDRPQTYSQIYPEWLKILVAAKKGDSLPELRTILEENFIQDEDEHWRRPDPEKEADLEKVRNHRLAREFKTYIEVASKPKGRIKEGRLEALRYGFRECYRARDFQTILLVAERLPESLLMEDEQLLQYYDIAANHA